mmetsp:Transcript_6658/g.17292  ORF Transcript_6658/g.17292 Transcript_6658/m.17292 type:complete len:96 (-) Transcript_6658:1778-2065(-)
MSVAGQQSPPGRAVLAPRDSGTSEVYFPWELDDAYYLRRVLAHAGAALLVVYYSTAVWGSQSCGTAAGKRRAPPATALPPLWGTPLGMKHTTLLR